MSLVLLAAAAAAGPAPCADLLPARAAPAARRPVEAEDLVRLRDIGPIENGWMSARLLALSPDGTRLAFQIRRADPVANIHCQAMLVMAARAGARPVLVDQGGEMLRLSFDFRGKAAFPTGLPLPITPAWSPDGRFVYFLKASGGPAQVWRAAADGSGSEAVTRSEDAIDSFRLAADGRSLVYASRPGLREARAGIEREGLGGYHYDDRYSPVSSLRPFPPAPIPFAYRVRDLAGGRERAASPAEAGWLRGAAAREGPAWTLAVSADGRTARVERDPSSPGGARLVAQDARGHAAACAAPACRGASRPWWRRDGKALRFLAREGWARASTAIYEWKPGPARPRRLLVTDDLLVDCVPDGDQLLCLRESALRPRRLERLDPASGRATTLFDPNPEFAALALGRAERLHWRNAYGLESLGDLVLPVGHEPGRSHPLVVVQYDTRGFLRGGTGDAFPIQALAGRGYAVLSVSRPADFGGSAPTADPDEGDRLNLIGLRDRRSTLSTVETGVRLAIARGIAEPGRIGITGLSDGAATAAFALIHSRLFSAASLSACCFEPSLSVRVGPSAARHFARVGYPRLTDPADAFWSEMSLVRNARRLTAPILFQVADDELMSTLETFTGLRELGHPADLFVFPGEHHVIWQPAHRLASFRRTLDWLDFWLKGIAPADPARAAELAHWQAMRAAWRAPPAQAGPDRPSQ